MATLFTRIINGELGCFKIYEDEHTMAFLSKFAVQPGHVLIVPKVEIDSFMDVPEPYYSAVFKAAQIVGRAVQSVTSCKRVGCMIAGWDVPHFHYHLVPMMSHEDMDPKNARELGFEENKKLQDKLVAEIASILTPKTEG
jgi:histidine triad (HIT) family protein